MENLKNKTIISKQVNLCDTRERDNFRLYWKDCRKMNFVPIHRLQLGGRDKTAKTWMHSHWKTSRKRRGEETSPTWQQLDTGHQWSGTHDRTIEKESRPSTCREESKESRGRNRSNGNGKSRQVHHPGHHKLHLWLSGKGHSHGGIPNNWENQSFLLFTQFRLQTMAIPYGRCKHYTHFARLHTRKFFPCDGLQHSVRVVLKKSSLMPCSAHFLMPLAGHLPQLRHGILRQSLPCCSLQLRHHPLLHCLADLPNNLL